MLRARVPSIGRSLLAGRSFAFTPRIMSEGDIGATRPGGHAAEYAHSKLFPELMANQYIRDAFSTRRKASEDKWIRDEEQAKSVAITSASYILSLDS
jgi:hypothetical protein